MKYYVLRGSATVKENYHPYGLKPAFSDYGLCEENSPKGCIFLKANEYLFKKRRPLGRGRLTDITGNDDQI
jgi:hypothetical protein